MRRTACFPPRHQNLRLHHNNGHDFPQHCGIDPSLTLKVTNRAKAMKASGEEVYGLAGGEPEMDTPENIKQAAIAALNNGATKYTPSAGLPALRQAIAEKLKRENNLEYDFTQITVGAGAKHACFNAIMATVSEGDEVIIPAPYWVSYPEMVRMCGGIPVIVETTAENGWKLTAEQFEEAMTPAPRWSSSLPRTIRPGPFIPKKNCAPWEKWP